MKGDPEQFVAGKTAGGFAAKRDNRSGLGYAGYGGRVCWNLII